MKVLYLTKYTRQGASSRMRSYQYFPILKKRGWSVDVFPFFDSNYLQELYLKKQGKWTILKAYLKRFFIIFLVFKYDRIVIEKEIFPYFPAFVEKLWSLLKIKYIVDYDDAIFHNYDLNSNKIIRSLLQKKIDEVMKNSSVTVVGNQYLATRAKLAGAKKIEILPTVVDLDKYFVSENKLDRPKKIIGWIGSPSTFKYLLSIKDVLKDICLRLDAEVHIVGASPKAFEELPFRYIPWTEETEIDLINSFDIGIMPLDDTPWARGKCAFKLIQYLAAGIPVVASPVGMNVEVAVDGVTGYTADTAEKWRFALEYLLSDSDLRQRLGEKGRELVEHKYALQVMGEKWIKILEQ